MVMDCWPLQSFNKGDVIISEGDKSDNIYLIEQGIVEIIKYTDNDNEVVVERLGPGQLFGEIGLIDNKPRTTTIVAASDLELKVVSREFFLDQFKKSPIFIQEIMLILISKLKHNSNLLTLLKLESDKRYKNYEKSKKLGQK